MTVTAATVRVRVPAKINLFLAVGPTRPDGYHDVTTVLQTVGLHDEVTAELCGTPWARQHPAARKLMRVGFTHDAGHEVPIDRDNLVVRAACALLNALGVEDDDRTLVGEADPLHDEHAPTTVIRLAKRIPVAAGMAGGSADAAATLVALDRLWGTELGEEELLRVGATIGADVPFCLHGGTALARGTGTRTCRVLARGTFHWVVGTARGDGLSTPEVYDAWDELDRGPGEADPDVVLQAVSSGDAALLARGVHNDLADAAVSLRPGLADDLEALRSAGALMATVSGSGPTVLGLAASEEDARAIAARVADRFGETTVVASPAGGPRVSSSVPPAA